MTPDRLNLPETDTIPSARRLGVLFWLRLLLPMVAAFLFFAFGAFYNVFAMQNGRPVRLSVLRLLFHTLKNAREYLLGAAPSPAVKDFYVMLVTVIVILLILFLVSVCLSVFAFYVTWRVRQARLCGDMAKERRLKILFRAILPNRKVMMLSHFLLLPLAFFPEIFSWLSGRFSTINGSVFYVKCNVTAVAVAVAVAATLILSLWLYRRERDHGFDLYLIEGNREEEKNSEN